MKGIHVEVVLAAAYVLFLIGTAVVLEALARHTHARAKRYRHRGFRFHRHLDVWECPAGEHLSRRETDPPRRLVRYRARAEKCNSCALKTLCTDSQDGREIVHSTEDWLETEIGRFHRGISLALLGLCALIVGIAWIRHHQALESAILAAVLAAVVPTAATFARGFRDGPAGEEEGAAKERPDSSSRLGLISISPWSDESMEDARRAQPSPWKDR